MIVLYMEALAMSNPLAAHPPWRQIAIIAVLLPLMIVLAVLAFAWPQARLAPQDLPVGIVGTGPASERVLQGLTRNDPGGFDVRLYSDDASARSAIEHRDIYGAFDVTVGRITVLVASAASPTAAQVLTTIGQQLARHASTVAAARGRPQAIQAREVDVVATSASDPRGLVLGSALLPLTICGVIMASIIALVLQFRPAWRQGIALISVSATAGLGAYLIVQGYFGALPHEHAATWAALSLTVLAIGAPVAGLIALIGPAGLGLGALLMIFTGNPFSAVLSAPQLLPAPIGVIGQWLPPGAAGSLLRGIAYFHGNGASGPLTVLIIWSALGLAAIVAGHHAPMPFAVRRAMAHSATLAAQPGIQAGSRVA
jgi:hypothetical protein